MNELNAKNLYKQQSIQVSSSSELILLLYNGCIKHMTLAKRALMSGNVQDAHKNLLKSQKIVVELKSSIDFNYKIGENLYNIYDYIYRELISCNINKKMNNLVECVDMIKVLRDTWMQILNKNYLGNR